MRVVHNSTSRVVHYSIDKSTWVLDKKKEYNIIEAGATFERLGCKYKDMLAFYERAMDLLRENNDDLRFCRKRWLYVKSRFAQEFSSDKDAQKTEMKSRRDSWGIAEIPQEKYPVLKKAPSDVLDTKENEVDVSGEVFTFGNINGTIGTERFSKDVEVVLRVPPAEMGELFEMVGEKMVLNLVCRKKLVRVRFPKIV